MRNNNKRTPAPLPQPKHPAPKTKEETVRQVAQDDPERAAQLIRAFLRMR